jgi:two-component system, chemotaxis family, CheB/CheR fusion protein
MPVKNPKKKKVNPRGHSSPPSDPVTRIVGIGASAGGLEAFTQLVSHLPLDAGFAYVLVQHLDPTHRSLLSELLGRSASLPVQEIVDGTPVAPNRIYVIPPNCDLALEGGILKLSPRELKKSGPPRSIDHFLESLAADQQEKAIGVILSGAGSDGAKGIKAIKQAGGLTFAQDERSSKHDSMPRSAINTGCVDFVLPPDRIAAEIARTATTPARVRRRAAANARHRSRHHSHDRSESSVHESATEAASPGPQSPRDPDLSRLLLLLRQRTGIDFGHYRMNTIRRRLKRRMGLHKHKTVSEYYRFLRDHAGEVEALYQDLLINVTSFFRNPTVFDALKKKVFPKLVRQCPEGESLRFWVAGCSTGQEAYSLAMAFSEFCEESSISIPVQIFATDVNATVLEYARLGRFTKPQVDGLDAARLQRFFLRENDTYRVQKATRDMVIFAQHNLLADPPFTRVDLVSCRNMLIYIESALQQKIIPVFHYALRPNGHLILGTSESVGSFSNLFAPVAQTTKIYVKKATMNRPYPDPLPALKLRQLPVNLPPRAAEPEHRAVDAYREADRLMLSKYAPPSTLVNEDGDVLQFRGKVQPFLEIASGKATLNIFKMAKGGLALALRKGLQRARTEKRLVREKAIAFDGTRQRANLEIVPLKSSPAPCYLILFERVAPPAKPAVEKGPEAPLDRNRRTEARRLADSKREYEDLRGQLEHLREEHDHTVEELQASNEEVQSSNEELQSLNEELETSNEELESANEELTTLNEELATRNAELRESEQRLREQAELVELAPLLARSAKDRIIFWNRGAERLYGFTKDEALGQTSHLLLRAEFPEPLEKIQSQLVREGRWEGEVLHRRKDGAQISVSTQWVAHLDDHHRIRAVLEVNTDVSARKRAEEALRQAQELNQRILESSPDSILVLDLAGRLRFTNQQAREAEKSGDLRAALGSHWTSLWTPDDRAAADTAYRTALAGEEARFQARAQAGADAPLRWWDVVVQPILDPAGHPEQLLAVCRDVTERKTAEELALAEARYSALRADVAVEVARGGELGPILQQLAQTILHHTEALHVRIWLARGEDDALSLFANAGQAADLANLHPRILRGEGRIGNVAATKRPYVTHRVSEDPEICDPEWARQERLSSFAAYPLLFETKLLGVLTILSRRPVEGRLLREVSLAADGIALLIQRKQSEEERGRLLQQAMDSRNEAMAASRAKDDFLATLSHELRTPLNPVLLLASDAAENPELPPSIRATFETIRNNVVLEARLIDDLLDLTRITRGKLALEMKRVDLHTVVREAYQIATASCDKTVTLSLGLTPEPAVIVGDPLRLQQVCWNIINNAVKFTPLGGRITVRSAITPTRTVRVQVIDSGVGMRAADLERIFDAFSQVDRRHGGLGLGLAISRQLVEEHRGTIRAHSEGPGQGSTFEIELPLAPAEQLDGAVDGSRDPLILEAKPEAEGRRRKITARGNGGSDEVGPVVNVPPLLRVLLVEDHASTRNALRALLLKRNFQVMAASSLAEARLRVQQATFDLVISDLGLPDGDGHQLMGELREKQPDLVGIALSGYGAEEDRVRSEAAGFAAHLTKPVSVVALNRVIAEVVGVRPSTR